MRHVRVGLPEPLVEPWATWFRSADRVWGNVREHLPGSGVEVDDGVEDAQLEEPEAGHGLLDEVGEGRRSVEDDRRAGAKVELDHGIGLEERSHLGPGPAGHGVAVRGLEPLERDHRSGAGIVELLHRRGTLSEPRRLRAVRYR